MSVNCRVSNRCGFGTEETLLRSIAEKRDLFQVGMNPVRG
jgi:hypothetical protein